MTRILMALPVMALLAGCGDYTQSQIGGAAGGAALGAVVTPHNRLQGALIGSAVGLAAGSLMGHTATGECLYERPDGTRYTAAC